MTAIRQAGVDHLAGLVFPGHTVAQVMAPNRESRRLVLSVTQWP